MSVITVAKPAEEIVARLTRRPDLPVVVIGCDKCAKLSHTGGVEEVLAMRRFLRGSSCRLWEVEGLPDAVEEGLCDPKAVPGRVAPLASEASKIQVLVLSCGAGLKCVRDALPGAVIVPGLDTLGPGVKGELACLSCGHCRFGEDGCAMLPLSRLRAERLSCSYPKLAQEGGS